MCCKTSTHILLTAVEYGKPQSKYYAKASVGNAALAFDQEYGQNGVIKTVFPQDYEEEEEEAPRKSY